MLLKMLHFILVVNYTCLCFRTQGTGKLAIVDSFDIIKLLYVHPMFIKRVVGQKSTSRVFESLVREAIDTAFDGFIHNKTLPGETDRRIDHRLLIGNTILAIETDEFAHQNYSKTKENTRYVEFLTETSYKVSIQSDYLFQSLVLISEDASKVSTKGLVCVYGPDAE